MESLLEAPESFGSSFEEESIFKDADFRERLKTTAIFGAFFEGSLISCAGFYALNLLKTKHRGFIFGVYTKPNYRGHGIATRFIKSVINYAQSRVTKLQLVCTTNNPIAIALYQKNGFKIYGTETRSLKIGDTYFD